MFKIFLRWLRIVTLCRVGLHKVWMKTPLTDKITITECECCHLSYVERNGRVYNFNRPDPLIAARGLLDRQETEPDAPIDQDAIPASARGWRLHTADQADAIARAYEHINGKPDAQRDRQPHADADFDMDADGH